MNNNTFETGATTHAVNDLILFTDNTSILAAKRDKAFKSALNNSILLDGLKDLLSAAIRQYKKEFPSYEDHKHITKLKPEQKKEFIDLYIDEYQEWKKEQETAVYILSQHGTEIFRGTENECYFKLQRVQGQSADWAMKYEGYKINQA